MGNLNGTGKESIEHWRNGEAVRIIQSEAEKQCTDVAASDFIFCG